MLARDVSGLGLMEIDEFSGGNSNSDTQIIYSGNHSAGASGSVNRSSLERDVSRKNMATIQEATKQLENTANLNQIQEEQKDGFGLDKDVNILNDSFTQQSAMKIINNQSKDQSLLDQVAAMEPKPYAESK